MTTSKKRTELFIDHYFFIQSLSIVVIAAGIVSMLSEGTPLSHFSGFIITILGMLAYSLDERDVKN